MENVAEQAKETVEVLTPVVTSMGEKMAQYMEAAQNIITQYGGDVAELGLNVLRVEALTQIIPGIVLLILAYPYYKIVSALYLHEVEKTGDGIASAIFGGALGIGLVIGTLISLFNIWAWVGLFYPEMYAVHLFLLK